MANIEIIEQQCVYAELTSLREALLEKDKEISKLRREVHKLKSVLERSELKRMPSISSCQGTSGTITGSFHHAKKCGVSGESWDESGGTKNEPSLLFKEPTKCYKDFRTRQLLRTAIGENSFLKNLDIEQIRDIVDLMYPQYYPQNACIISEGEPGSHLYVCAEGQLDVYQDDTFLGTMGPGKAFGELALLYNCKRTATVKAIGECKVWALERRAFQQVMVKVGMRRMEDRLSFLKSIPLLKGLDLLLLSRIADQLEIETYTPGTYIIREGATGDTFYIISRGRVEVTASECSSDPDKSDSEPDANQGIRTVVLRELQRGDYFGEQALLKEEKRSANVIALPPTGCECLTLDREAFFKLIGDLSEFKTFSRRYKVKDEDYKVMVNGEEDLSSTLNGLAETLVPLNEHRDIDTSKLELDDLEIVATLGIGGFGRVELVQLARDSSTVFALKCLPKAHILATQQKEHVYAERNIMKACNFPFIVRLYKTLKDSKFLYLVMEACLGGEIWTILRDRGSFDEDTARFTVGCVLLALEYLHNKNIVYRDLKPENLMLSNSGYVKLVDFGFSKTVPSGQRTWTFCGTPEYVAPEVILNKGHDRAVDFWGIGVLLFELLTGSPPWGPMAVYGNNVPDTSDPLTTYNQILKGIDSVPFPKNLSRRVHSLIRKLCRQSPGERLGSGNGIRDIMTHRWFNGFDWDKLKQLKMPPPIVPHIKSPIDTSNFDKFELDVEDTPEDLSGWDHDF